MEDLRKIEEGFHEEEKSYYKNEVLESGNGFDYDNEENNITLDLLNQPVGKNAEQVDVIMPKRKRIATLDASRGLTVVLMILLNDTGELYPSIDHSPWNGCSMADFGMPFFLFIVGVAIALAFERVPKVGTTVRRIIIRTIKMIFWGVLLQGGYSHAPHKLVYGVDMKEIRWCGILQRIALVYLVVALIETLTIKLRPTTINPGFFSIFVAYKWQWIGGLVCFLVYMITTFGLYVPDWSFSVQDENGGDDQEYIVKCGMRGHLGPACNAVGYVDRQVWGVKHLYTYPVWSGLKTCTSGSPPPTWCRAPFDPEGLLSSISSILTGTIGIHYGHVLVHFNGHYERLKHWVTMGLSLITLALILHFTDAIPMNKQLYSFSYVCFTAGVGGIIFCGLYLLIDVSGFRKPFLFLEWIGMNAMLVFVMAAQGIFAAFINGWYYERPENNLISWIKDHMFIAVWKSKSVGTLLYVIFAEIVFWAVVSGILHKLGIYWKL